MTASFGLYSSTAFCHGGAPPYGGFKETGADWTNHMFCFLVNQVENHATFPFPASFPALYCGWSGDYWIRLLLEESRYIQFSA